MFSEFKFQNKYKLVEKLGEGAFGQVFKAREIKTNQTVAVKKIFDCEDSFGGISTTTLREISILNELDHPYIIKLQEVFYEDEENETNIYLVFEYGETDLRKFLLQHKDKLSLNRIKLIMFQLLQAILSLHQDRIFHRDIKPCNIILMADGTIKLADFGLARYFFLEDSEYTLPIQTLHYRAPEVCLSHRGYGPPVDIWGAGCVFIEMLERTVLFSGDSEIEEIFKIFNFFGTPDPSSSLFNYPAFNCLFPKFPKKNLRKILINSDEEAIDLFEKMMKLEPEKRITAKSALLHKFFEGMDYSSVGWYGE